ncbi:hypothetical protein RQP46_004709 [Phenoliferia psychrophenolica]
MSYAPFIVAPPFTSCEQSYLVFGQGTAPYQIFPISSGDKSGTSLEGIPLQAAAGVFEWRVDFDSGANITWVLVDAKGLSAYSDARSAKERPKLTRSFLQFRVVQSGSATTCSRNVYSTKHSDLGAILGGVLGGVFGILLLLLMVFFFRRHKYKSKKRDPRHSGRDSRASSLMGETTPTNGETRIGTFNLGHVALNEGSVERSREGMGAPPVYEGAAKEDDGSVSTASPVSATGGLERTTTRTQAI